MSANYLVAVLLTLALFGYFFGRSRSLATANGEVRNLHSLPSHYGMFVALWAGVPGLILILVWLSLQSTIVEGLVLSGLTPDSIIAWANATLPEQEAQGIAAGVMREGTEALSTTEIQLLLINIRNLATGNESFVNPAVVGPLGAAAEHYSQLQSLADWMLVALGSVLAIIGLTITSRLISPGFRARNNVEWLIKLFLIVCSTIAVFTTVGIILSLLFESFRFFTLVPITDFLFGLRWSPQMAIRPDQAGASGAFGAVPLITGTLLIAAVAMTVAAPVGLMSAIYLSDYAPRGVRNWVKPILEILAGVPTVVYGFFAILTVAPFIREFGASIGLEVSANSALAAGIVMGIMIVPFVSSLSDDVINAVPQSLRDGSAGLGATKSETITQVVLPAALPGIVGAMLLAVSRAIGETMIVVMAAGLAANLTANPLEAVTTVTVQIQSLLIGDTEFDSPKVLSVFALGLLLFSITLVLNVIALRIVQKYREKYD